MTKSDDSRHSATQVLGIKLAKLTPNEVIACILRWALAGQKRYVCVADVHQCVESYEDPSHHDILDSADLVLPDSRILAWAHRLLADERLPRITRGADLMVELCEEAARRDLPIGLYGGTIESLSILQDELHSRFPRLRIAVAISPPFRELSSHEEASYIEQTDNSGARILFVGIGCPKQERWMAKHHESLETVMLGVGAAFDYISGATRSPPRWVHQIGLEWFYRLCIEPRRLWRRYLVQNPKFVYYCALQKIGRLPRHASGRHGHSHAKDKASPVTRS